MSGSIWVDDCKPCPSGMSVARTFDDALYMLRRFDYDDLYIDHDLADHHRPERTGYDLVELLERNGRLPRRVICISWNPVGVKRIHDALAEYGYRPTSHGFERNETTVRSGRRPIDDAPPYEGRSE